MRTLLACSTIVAALGATGCPNIPQDPGETVGVLPAVGGPTVEFDPANSIIPFPNNLILDPATGKVNAPASCNEGPVQKALREDVINKLDGFGTYEVGLQATFTATPDEATLSPTTVLLYKRADAGVAVDPATAQPVPAHIFIAKFPRLAADCVTVSMIDTATIVPLVPLDQHSTYTVAIVSGVQSGGVDMLPSATWSFVRQTVDPVTIDASGNIIAESTPFDPTNQIDQLKLKGIDLLWKAHAGALAFLDATTHLDRSKILLAWDFNTQTTTDPLDHHVPDSPAGKVATTPFAGVASALTTLCGGPCTAQQFLEGSPVGTVCTTTNPASGYIPCNATGDILGGVLLEDIYQTDVANAFDAAKPIPGPWNDPLHPTVVHANAQIPLVAMIPATAAPAGGYPTVIFGHGLGSKKETIIAIGAQLNALGYAVVGIDFVDHGQRAVQITNDAALGCDGAKPDASVLPQCFAPFLSADLAADRDNFRQSIVDLHRLHAALKACGASPTPATCGALKVDATKIEYLGISLGGILGSTFASTADLKAATLNVPGVGWLDIIENTKSLDISCTVVDALIGAGILVGDKSSGATLTTPPTAGLCTETDANGNFTWKTQPAYQVFSSAARWVLDPADGANFTPKLKAQKILIQEVVDDQVVPNVATDFEGALVGLTPGTADLFVPPTPPATPQPSAALGTATSNVWVRYPTLPAAGQFPGNAFQHASLLSPIQSAAGVLGTVRLETDALAFLFANIQ